MMRLTITRSIIIMLAIAHGYSLQRAPKAPEVKGFACIPVPVDRLVAPGQRATMHIYDTSSMAVIRHAQSNANGTYGQVVIDDEAMAERVANAEVLEPRDIADTYWHVHNQPRGVWTQELDLRPWKVKAWYSTGGRLE